MSRLILHPRYDKTAPTADDELARLREALERVKQRKLEEAES